MGNVPVDVSERKDPFAEMDEVAKKNSRRIIIWGLIIACVGLLMVLPFALRVF